MNAILKKTVLALARLACRAFPKNKRKMVFFSTPDYSGNARALGEFISREHPDYSITWLVASKDMADHLRSHGVHAVKRVSLKGALAAMQAKYIIITHGFPSELVGRRQHLVNLYHGMPLKGMGFAHVSLMRDERSLHRLKRSSEVTSMLVSTSQIASGSLASCFYIDPRRIAITGQPRNDYLFACPHGARRQLETLICHSLDRKKVIMYLPTFRRGIGYTDGVPHGEQPGHFLKDQPARTKMEAFLEREGAVLVAKMHPLEETVFQGERRDSNIFVIRDSIMTEKLVDLYQILAAADVLLTDYSSVHFDFLLLDRPVAFLVPDLVDYEASRGFVLTPYDFWTPGPKCFSVDDLTVELGRCLRDKRYFQQERHMVCRLMNAHDDAGSSRRAFDAAMRL